METTKKQQKTAKAEVKYVSQMAKNKIKPRGLAGWMKGKIHYDEDADIFNLKPLSND
jgi:hypothetical protein